MDTLWPKPLVFYKTTLILKSSLEITRLLCPAHVLVRKNISPLDRMDQSALFWTVDLRGQFRKFGLA